MLKLTITKRGMFDSVSGIRYYPECLLDYCEGEFEEAFRLKVLPKPKQPRVVLGEVIYYQKRIQ